MIKRSKKSPELAMDLRELAKKENVWNAGNLR